MAMARCNWLRFVLLIVLLMPLTGCIGALYGLEAAAAIATIGDNVLGIDMSLKQNNTCKTPISVVVP